MKKPRHTGAYDQNPGSGGEVLFTVIPKQCYVVILADGLEISHQPTVTLVIVTVICFDEEYEYHTADPPSLAKSIPNHSLIRS